MKMVNLSILSFALGIFLSTFLLTSLLFNTLFVELYIYQQIYDLPIFSSDEAIAAVKESKFVIDFLTAHPDAENRAIYWGYWNQNSNYAFYNPNLEPVYKILDSERDITLNTTEGVNAKNAIKVWYIEFFYPLENEDRQFPYMTLVLEDNTANIWEIMTNYYFLTDLTHSLDEVLTKVNVIPDISNFTINENIALLVFLFISFDSQGLYSIIWQLYYYKTDYEEVEYGKGIMGYSVRINAEDLLIFYFQPIINHQWYPACFNENEAISVVLENEYCQKFLTMFPNAQINTYYGGDKYWAVYLYKKDQKTDRISDYLKFHLEDGNGMIWEIIAYTDELILGVHSLEEVLNATNHVPEVISFLHNYSISEIYTFTTLNIYYVNEGKISIKWWVYYYTLEARGYGILVDDSDLSILKIWEI